MFPLPWNKAFRKKDGSLTTLDAAISSGGGGSDLPDYDSSDAGKVLTVGDDGSLEWDENGGAGVEVISESDWNNMTTAEKQAAGIVAIQSTSGRFVIGRLVDGSYYEIFTVEQTYIDEGSVTITRDDTNRTISFNFVDVPNIGGAVVSINENVTGVALQSSNGNSQMGTCTKDATLPTIITQGAGRQDWYSGGATNKTINPVLSNAFIGITTNQPSNTFTATFRI